MCVFFCDSNSKFLSSSFRAFHSWVGGDVCVVKVVGGGEGGGRACPPIYVQYCHSAIRWAA